MTDVEDPAPAAAQAVAEIDLENHELYFNRELSWLEFNSRVLELAEDPSVPLLERVKFCAIVSSNLDEFVMVRVAGLHDQVEAGLETPLQDGRTPAQTIDAIRTTMRRHYARQTRCLDQELRPALAEHGIRIVGCADVDDGQRAELDDRFRRQIFPVLTPLAVGLGRPFPYISNLSLSLGVVVRDPVSGTETFARVKVPKEMLPRFMRLDDGRTFVPLEELIASNLDELFPGMEIVDYAMFRVTRDADYTVSDEADDLLQAVEDELRRRRFGEVVRVEVSADMGESMREQLMRRARRRGGRRRRGRRPARPQGPLRPAQGPWPPGAARPAVVARDPAAAAARRGRGGRRDGGDAQGRHPRPPPLRLLLDLGRAAGGGGGRRRAGARDQDDGLPHERRLAARPRPDPGGGAAASRRSAWSSSRPASTSARTSPGAARWRRPACTSSTACPRSRRTPSAS